MPQEEKLRRKLAKVQTDLADAQGKRALAITRGEEEIEAARIRAERRVTRATERVERRSAEVVRIEAQLAGLRHGRGANEGHRDR